MMKYLEMNIKRKILLMRKMCYDLETNTRKITPNIFEYIKRVTTTQISISNKKYALCLISN